MSSEWMKLQATPETRSQSAFWTNPKVAGLAGSDVKAAEDRHNAIFAMESLRSGIPTRLSTRILPDLRKNVTDRILADLESFADGKIPAGRMLWGQYGQGKTHALTTIEHKAMDMNFAVSRVTLSREVSCHNLFQLFGQLVPRLRTSSSTQEGIQPCLSTLHADELEGSILFDENRYSNLLPRYVLMDALYSEGEDKEKLLGEMAGVRLPIGEIGRIHRALRGSPLPKCQFKVTEEADAYYGVIADALHSAGYEGWVILLDEVELIGRLGKQARLKAYRNLYWLMNWSGRMKYPLYVVGAAASRLQDDLWYGKTDDDRTIMPELAKLRYGEEEARNMTSFFSRAIGSESLSIPPAGQTELTEMLDSIAGLHGHAYNWAPSFHGDEILAHLGAQPARTYVRAALEYLDLQMLYAGESEAGAVAVPNSSSLTEIAMGEDPESVEQGPEEQDQNGHVSE